MNIQTRTLSVAGVPLRLPSLAAVKAETDTDRVAMSRADMRLRSIVQRVCSVAALAACIVATTGAAHAGPTSPLYLSTAGQIVVIQGSTADGTPWDDGRASPSTRKALASNLGDSTVSRARSAS